MWRNFRFLWIHERCGASEISLTSGDLQTFFSRNLFCCDLYTFFLRKKEPKIVCVEKITNLRFDKMQQDQRPLDVLIAFLN